MGKFTGKLLVSDMDATLLNEEHRVSEENRKAIEYFMSEGGKFTVAYGRMVAAVRAYFNQMAINAPAVLHNGAKLYDYENERVLFERFIAEPRKECIRRFHDEVKNAGMEIYSDERVYVYRANFKTERFKTKPYDVVYEMPDSVWNRPWIKVLIIDEREKLDAYEKLYREKYDKGYCVRSGDNYFDIVADGVSKGLGVMRLAELLEIKKEDVYCVGDHINDIDMLKAAGHSYAVMNAEECVKETADEIIPSCNESAVAYIINNM